MLEEYRRCSRHWMPVLQKFAEGALMKRLCCVLRSLAHASSAVRMRGRKRSMVG